MSTLCAGCGHDSITAAIVQAFWELDMPPHKVAKLSGIGCSSKTTAYFLKQAHGFNGVHGRMPAIATGAKFDLTVHFEEHDGVTIEGRVLTTGCSEFKLQRLSGRS